jgi:hypothetical protein
LAQVPLSLPIHLAVELRGHLVVSATPQRQSSADGHQIPQIRAHSRAWHGHRLSSSSKPRASGCRVRRERPWPSCAALRFLHEPHCHPRFLSLPRRRQSRCRRRHQTDHPPSVGGKSEANGFRAAIVCRTAPTEREHGVSFVFPEY